MYQFAQMKVTAELTLLNWSKITPFFTRNSRVSMTICVSPSAIRTPRLSFDDLKQEDPRKTMFKEI